METPASVISETGTFSGVEARASEKLPERVGRFQILRRLGEGGFGLVLLANDPLLRRQVALKLPRAVLVADSKQELRFLREARAAACLSHPHIVPVFEVGREGDQYFFSMGYVEGESLNARVEREGPLPPAQAARLIEQIAEAVDYAHRRGVVHRDLKPQNVLLAQDGQPMVTDFGLAKHSGEADGLTVSGQVMGTPAFMSPEQAQGRLSEIGPRSDVYSLGAMFYYLLTGRPPFCGESVMETLKQVVEAEPMPPRKLKPAIPRDLETISLKCLDKSPQRRYGTARELAEDLRHNLDCEPILARPVTRVERAWRSVRRRPAVAALCAAVILALAIGTGLSTRAHFRETALQNEIRADQLSAALHDATVATLSGNLDDADAAISRAEALDAPAWRVTMLRGQTAYFRGEYGQALEKLGQAAAEQPKNVAAQSMYAAACVAAGKWEQYETTLSELQQLTPATPEDHLFKGLAESYLDPRRGLSSLDEAVRLRNSEMARLIRAEVRCSLARDTGDAKDAEEAIDDARFALEMLPGHASALLTSMNANLIAEGIFGAAGDVQRQSEARQQAAADASALERFSHLPLVVVDLAFYLHVTGRDPAGRQLLREAAAARPDESLIGYNLALALCRAGESRTALELLAPTDNLTDNARWLRVWLLMEEGQREAALEAYDELKDPHAFGLDVLFRPCLLLLMGQRAKAVAESRSLQSQPIHIPPFRAAFYRELLRYNCGELTEQGLLQAAGTSQWDRCEACFFIALHHLADGERLAARERFHACLATRCYGGQAWDWSAAALARLEADLAWPRWISDK